MIPPTNDPSAVWIRRKGHRAFSGHNQRGAEVAIGDATFLDMFSPGELLKLALAGCVGLSSDHVASRALGEDHESTIIVHGKADAQENKYTELFEEFIADASALDEKARLRLLTTIERVVDKYCTVGRSVQDGIDLDLNVNLDGPATEG